MSDAFSLNKVVSDSNRQATTLVFLATYNERENLPDLLDAIFEQLPEADLLVVDDNSPDGTGDWVEEKRKTDKRVFCLHRSGKLGLGSAVVDALQYAQAKGYTYVISMDADFSHPPVVLPVMLQLMEQSVSVGGSERFPDIVIGSRYIRGGGVSGWPLKRRLMSRAVNWYARLLLGLRTKDNSGAFRCIRVEFLKKVRFDKIRSRGYSFFEEFLFRMKQSQAVFVETPITFVDRVRGQSKINQKEARAALWIILTIGIRRLLFLERSNSD